MFFSNVSNATVGQRRCVLPLQSTVRVCVCVICRLTIDGCWMACLPAVECLMTSSRPHALLLTSWTRSDYVI
jgi:hypothetical protein